MEQENNDLILARVYIKIRTKNSFYVKGFNEIAFWNKNINSYEYNIGCSNGIRLSVKGEVDCFKPGNEELTTAINFLKHYIPLKYIDTLDRFIEIIEELDMEDADNSVTITFSYA